MSNYGVDIANLISLDCNTAESIYGKISLDASLIHLRCLSLEDIVLILSEIERGVLILIPTRVGGGRIIWKLSH